MCSRKVNIVPTMKNSIDYFNFCTVNNDLPILKILNERFTRCFRVSLSNYLRMITNIEYSDQKIEFGDWVKEQEKYNCMFIVKFQKVSAPILLKFDRTFAYNVVDILTGGTNKDVEKYFSKEFTQIELSLLKEIGLLAIQDLNEAWSPVQDIRAKYVRTEVNSQFVGIIPNDAKVIKIDHKVTFNNIEGHIEILFPYSTLFPMRNELFTME